MTRTDFNDLLKMVDALSPDQMRRLISALESRVAATAKRPTRADARHEAAGKTTGQRAKRARAEVSPTPKKPLTIEELHQQMMAEGLITQLPDTAADFDDPDDEPITIKGEPLSETIIRERR
jgi:hypothetical protein